MVPVNICFCHCSERPSSEQSDDRSAEAESQGVLPDSDGGPDSLVPDSLLAERFSPDKMPQLTRDQQKALAGSSIIF